MRLEALLMLLLALVLPASAVPLYFLRRLNPLFGPAAWYTLVVAVICLVLGILIQSGFLLRG